MKAVIVLQKVHVKGKISRKVTWKRMIIFETYWETRIALVLVYHSRIYYQMYDIIL